MDSPSSLSDSGSASSSGSNGRKRVHLTTTEVGEGMDEKRSKRHSGDEQGSSEPKMECEFTKKCNLSSPQPSTGSEIDGDWDVLNDANELTTANNEKWAEEEISEIDSDEEFLQPLFDSIPITQPSTPFGSVISALKETELEQQSPQVPTTLCIDTSHQPASETAPNTPSQKKCVRVVRIDKTLSNLIPYEWESLTDALEIFKELFQYRYGDYSPNFRADCLASMLINGLGVNAKKRGKKGLVIYLHNDRSLASGYFPCQSLCVPEVASILRDFYVWGWDMTQIANREMFRDWLVMLEVFDLWSDVVTMPMRRYPLLVLMADVGGMVMPVDVLNGQRNKKEVIAALETLGSFSSTQ